MKIILLTIISCLLPNIANAEGAWVLWERNTELRSTSDWKIVAAFPKYEQCIERHNKDFEIIKGVWGGVKKIQMLSSETIVIEKYHSDTAFGDWVITQKCLPDTIDPRDKKE